MRGNIVQGPRPPHQRPAPGQAVRPAVPPRGLRRAGRRRRGARRTRPARPLPGLGDRRHPDAGAAGRAQGAADVRRRPGGADRPRPARRRPGARPARDRAVLPRGRGLTVAARPAAAARSRGRAGRWSPSWRRSSRPQAAASAIELILQGQTLHRWELLLVGDDAGQPPVLHDGRARVVPLAPGTDWRNAGLAEAAGTYVAFLMPGHHWRADFLQGAVQWLHDSGHEAGHAAVSLHDATGQVTVMSGSADLQTLRAGGWIDVGTLVCTTEVARAVGGFEPGLGPGRRARVRDPAGRRGPGSTRSPSWPATGWCRPCPASRRPPRAPTATGWR